MFQLMQLTRQQLRQPYQVILVLCAIVLLQNYQLLVQVNQLVISIGLVVPDRLVVQQQRFLVLEAIQSLKPTRVARALPPI